MKNKKWIILCATVLVILAVLLIWKPFGSCAAKTETVTESSSAEPVEQQTSQQAEPTLADKTETDTAAEETAPDAQESTGATILENGGDLEIIIPDDEESDGF